MKISVQYLFCLQIMRYTVHSVRLKAKGFLMIEPITIQEEERWMNKSLRNVWLGVSIFAILVGLCMIVWPSASRDFLCYSVGAALVIAALVQAILQWQSTKESGSVSGYFSAILLLLFGLLLLLRKDAALSIWGFVWGALLVLDSLYKAGIALQLKKWGRSSWIRTIIVAIALLICGIIMLFAPAQATAAATVLIGIALVLNAAANIWAYIDSRA